MPAFFLLRAFAPSWQPFSQQSGEKILLIVIIKELKILLCVHQDDKA